MTHSLQYTAHISVYKDVQFLFNWFTFVELIKVRLVPKGETLGQLPQNISMNHS